jgi:signal transduction histidine kinase
MLRSRRLARIFQRWWRKESDNQTQAGRILFMRMETSGRILQRFKTVFLASRWTLVAWTTLGLIAGGSAYIRALAVGGSHDRPYVIFKHFLLEYWIWAALTPLIFRFCRLVPFRAWKLAKVITAHVGFCVLVSLLHAILAQLLALPIPFSRAFHGPVVAGRFIWMFYSDVWMYCGTVGVWTLLEYNKKLKERERRAAQLQVQLAEARLQALRNQLQPHFLFNTLNSISALIQEDPEAAEDMLADLSFMLRAVLERSTEHEIPFCRELELLNAYFRIQLRRFTNLSVDMQVGEDTNDALVPCLLLQPIVENAVRHGIAPLSRSTHIWIRSRCQVDRLLLEVADDGNGLPPEYREGVGLTNTRERLWQAYYADQSLNVENRPGGGVAVTIEIPLRLAGNEGETCERQGDHSRRRRASTSQTSLIARN